jgi:uncharacterized protein (DUF1684 family)
MKILFLGWIAFYFTTTSAQNNAYIDSVKQFIDNYVKTHGVVMENDKKYLQFYPINEKYRVSGRFERTENSPWFMMESSGPVKKSHRVYGKIHFQLNDTAVSLCIYQSQDLMKIEQYKDYLFLPLMDATTGEETYESGRYIDLTISDIISDNLVIDFNKAYNPYCAYVSEGYNCPVPPKENRINVAIKAGEKKYLKAGH